MINGLHILALINSDNTFFDVTNRLLTKIYLVKKIILKIWDFFLKKFGATEMKKGKTLQPKKFFFIRQWLASQIRERMLVPDIL